MRIRLIFVSVVLALVAVGGVAQGKQHPFTAKDWAGLHNAHAA